MDYIMKLLHDRRGLFAIRAVYSVFSPLQYGVPSVNTLELFNRLV